MYLLHKSLKEPIRIKYEVVMRMRENNRVYDLSKLHCNVRKFGFKRQQQLQKAESLEKSPNVIRQFVQNKCRLGFS